MLLSANMSIITNPYLIIISKHKIRVDIYFVWFNQICKDALQQTDDLIKHIHRLIGLI